MSIQEAGQNATQQTDYSSPSPLIHIDNLTMAYGSNIIQRDLTFDIHRGDIFIVMGGSGCGKSTLLKHLIGLLHPATGKILYNDVSYFDANAAQQASIRRSWGTTFQTGGLFSAMTLAEISPCHCNKIPL